MSVTNHSYYCTRTHTHTHAHTHTHTCIHTRTHKVWWSYSGFTPTTALCSMLYSSTSVFRPGSAVDTITCTMKCLSTHVFLYYFRLWENSKYVSKQLDKIGSLTCSVNNFMYEHFLLFLLILLLFLLLLLGLTLSTVLVNAGFTTFDKLLEANPRELELIVNRHPPFGNQVSITMQ